MIPAYQLLWKVEAERRETLNCFNYPVAVSSLRTVSLIFSEPWAWACCGMACSPVSGHGQDPSDAVLPGQQAEQVGQGAAAAGSQLQHGAAKLRLPLPELSQLLGSRVRRQAAGLLLGTSTGCCRLVCNLRRIIRSNLRCVISGEILGAVLLIS